MTPPNAKKDEIRPRGLGRGLSALIGDEAAAVKGEPAAKKDARTLPVAFLRPGKYQPRKSFDEQPLADLAASVKEKGVLSPILVRPLGPESYEIVAGERRWRAAQIAKLHDVPVVIREMSTRSSINRAIWSTCRLSISATVATLAGSPGERRMISTPGRIGARGLRSSCARVARKASLRRPASRSDSACRRSVRSRVTLA